MIIYAVNISSGGGKVLLDRLLLQNPFEQTTAVFLDQRYSPPAEFTGQKFSFSRLFRVISAFKLQSFIKQPAHKNESVLFFGNIPPFLKPKNKAYLYLQNCYLTRQVPLPNDSIFEKFRNFVESCLLKLLYKNVDEIWVQTEWMKTVTQKYLPKAIIKIHPFLPLLPHTPAQTIKTFKFIWVGSLSINKGFDLVFNALQDLNKNLNTQVEVALVFNNNEKDLYTINEKLKELHFVKALTFSNLSREALFKLYQGSEYFICSSRYESFCLPIYEAHHFGCKLIIPQNTGYGESLRSDFKVNWYNLEKLDLTKY